MAKKAVKPVEPVEDFLLNITTDYLVNPSSDTPLEGEMTRGELEALGVDVDGLIERGTLEVTNHVRQAS